MFRKLIRSTPSLLRRVSTVKISPKNFYLCRIIDPPKLIFLTQCAASLKSDMENLDLNLQRACQNGEAAVTEFLESLREKILEISQNYKECLSEQISIMKEASKSGALSEKWDELPKFRSMADELSQELNAISASLSTVSEIAHSDLMKFITDHKKIVQLIDKNVKGLNKLIKKEMDDIKKLEKKIVKLDRDNILKTK